MTKIRTKFPFAFGFTAAMLLMLFLNVLPYLWSDTFPAKDAMRTLGFPMEFHKQGGKHGVYEFHYGAALVDAAVVLVLAFEVGYLCRRIQGPRVDAT